jgi:hypothetical protein
MDDSRTCYADRSTRSTTSVADKSARDAHEPDRPLPLGGVKINPAGPRRGVVRSSLPHHCDRRCRGIQKDVRLVRVWDRTRLYFLAYTVSDLNLRGEDSYNCNP